MRCLGYRYGTGCNRHSPGSQNTSNWDRQLCYNCDLKIYPEFHKNEKIHGTKSIHKDKMMEKIIASKDNIESEKTDVGARYYHSKNKMYLRSKI